jgi:HAD superfamily hydrolase (TIGR01509 family)
MAISAIIFDCFGVLILPGSKLLYRKYPQFYNELNDLEHQANYGMISEDEYYEAVSKLVGVDAAKIRKEYFRINARDEEVIDWIKELKADGEYKLALISNVVHGPIPNFIPEYETLFDTAVLSSDVCVAKPEKEIFEIAAERLGVPTDECIMIDDNQINVEGAISAGMHGILYGNIDQCKEEIDIIVRGENA